MERAYIDSETGRVICCWSAESRQQVVDLVKRAGVTFEAIVQVNEVLEKDFS
ncbi:MAG: hypothetical protein NTW14_13730 [bacterium]|nr:hypothetical protein [bacterium]